MLHCCNICGNGVEFDELVWVNPNIGMCLDCYNALPENVKEHLVSGDYDAETRAWLDENGISY